MLSCQTLDWQDWALKKGLPMFQLRYAYNKVWENYVFVFMHIIQIQTTAMHDIYFKSPVKNFILANHVV